MRRDYEAEKGLHLRSAGMWRRILVHRDEYAEAILHLWCGRVRRNILQCHGEKKSSFVIALRKGVAHPCARRRTSKSDTALVVRKGAAQTCAVLVGSDAIVVHVNEKQQQHFVTPGLK